MIPPILKAIVPVRFVQWIGPLAAAGIAALIVATVVLTAGWLDLSASTPHPQGWAALLHAVFRRSTAHHAADIVPPASFGSPRQVEKGAAYYGQICARCHGAPGFGQNPVALSMTPRPQYLPHEVAKFSPSELFWIVKHGVKYSAMPAWPVQDRDDEVWSVVSFLKKMPTMTPTAYLALTDRPATPISGAAAVPPTGSAVPYALPHSNEPPVDQYAYRAPAVGFTNVPATGPAVASCTRCHGADGAGSGTGAFPNLALLSKTYIRDALINFRSGKRHSGYMQPIAVQLSNERIDAVAAYYAAQQKRGAVRRVAPADLLALGQRIAAQGDASRGVGACATCHGAEGASPKGFSALDGQYAAYLADQLKLFRAGHRGNAAGDPMVGAAKRLSDREIDGVSLYYASRAPNAPHPSLTPATIH